MGGVPGTSDCNFDQRELTMPILKREAVVYPDDLLEVQEDQVETNADRSWWAVYTKARQEKALARGVRQQEIPFYLPVVRRDNLIRGRRVHSYVPLFSGYVFVFGNEHERQQCWTTNCVSRILPVLDGEQLRQELREVQRLIQADVPLTPERRLVPGQRVRVKKGSFAGVEGSVLARRRQTRVVVEVTFLQQGVSFEIDDFLLEPLEYVSRPAILGAVKT